MNANASAADISNIVVRDVKGQKELRAVEELQKEVWGMPDLDVVPLTQLVAAQEAGGVLLGAFDDETLVGFVYGFAGYEDGRVTHHSHMLAVKPSYRNLDLGSRLKLAQRERVLSQGISLMTWTFDPLQSLNAYINFSKLGVVSDRYLINFYGEDAASFLHRTGTDRLWVTWRLTGSRTDRQIEEINFNEELGHLTPLVKVGSDDFPLISELEEGLKADHALIEIPSNINELASRNSGLTKKWRESTRRTFTGAIEAGFLVENFYRTDRGGKRLGTYLLTRKN